MNFKILFLFLLTAIVLLGSCGKKAKEAAEALSALENMATVGKNMEKEVEKLENKYKERRERGDTLAMHYEDLANFLPISTHGFEPDGDLDGNTTNMMGMSYSNVRQRYADSDGNSLTIEIIDYNAANSLFVAATAVYGTGMEIDNTDERMKGYKLSEDIKGWEVLKKKRNKASVFAGVVGRFFISIEAEGQNDTDGVKDILNAMNLNKMTEL